jgi:hypothetical protein
VIPDWISDEDELLDVILKATGRSLNMPDLGSGGHGITVGIIDSAYELPDKTTEGYTVHQTPQNSFLDTNEGMTTPHGEAVFNVLSSYAPRATFRLYQAVNKKRDLETEAYSDAISKAIRDDVDILNVSAGDPWPGPTRSNPYTQITSRAIEAGISVIAAAGNQKPDGPNLPVHCPAAMESIIAVGAMEVRCPIEPGEVPNNSDCGPYYCVPDDPPHQLTPGDQSFCSQAGCVDGESCIENQHEVAWEGNPLSTDGKPDVLAPMHRVVERGNDPFLKVGTSFSAPVVAGSLACICGGLIERGDSMPDPWELRDAVLQGRIPIDSREGQKYDAMGVRNVFDID